MGALPHRAFLRGLRLFYVRSIQDRHLPFAMNVPCLFLRVSAHLYQEKRKF